MHISLFSPPLLELRVRPGNRPSTWSYKVYDGGIRKSTVVTLCHPGGLSINCKKIAWYESWLMAT